MPNLAKKIIISVVLFWFTFLSVFVPSVKAADQTGPWYNQNFGQWSTKVFGGDQSEIFGERYTYAQVTWIVNSLITIVIGSDVAKCITAGSNGDLKAIGNCASNLAPVDPTKLSGYIGMSGGTITGLAYLAGNLAVFKPASGIGYIKTTASRLHVIPEAYAQTGAGYITLSPVQGLWIIVRNISYTFMVLVIIAMAFMIMFRVKISPQVVISIQSALPRVVTALILITFSYAIAGFLVDLTYVVVGAFAAMIKIGGSSISNGSLPYLFGQLNSINGLVSLCIGLLIFAVILSIGGFIGPIAGIAGTVAIGPFAAVPILGGIILLIGAIFILWILVRLLWLLIKTAIITILLIAGSPLMILTGTLSTTGGFLGWFRTLAANLAVYPTVIIMLFLSHYFFWGWAAGFITGIWPANIPNPLNTYSIAALNLNGGSGIINLPGMPIGTSVVGFFASFMIIFLIPKAADVIQGIITGKGMNYGAAIGEAIGPSRGVALYGAAKIFTTAEQKAAGTPGGVTPAWVQAGRRIFGIKP